MQRRNSRTIHDALLEAAESNEVNEVLQLLGRGAHINYVNPDGHTALIEASIEGHEELIQVLITQGADVNLSGLGTDKPILIAARNKHFGCVRLLAASGADVNAMAVSSPAYYGGHDRPPQESALHFAAQEGSIETILALLAKGAHIDLQNVHGFTPLHLANAQDQEKAINVLVENGANIDLRDYDGKSVLDYAREYSHEERCHYYIKVQSDRLAKNRSYLEIRKASRLLAQGYRNNGSLFNRLPREMNLHIASKAANPEVHSKKEAHEIASTYFGRP